MAIYERGAFLNTMGAIFTGGSAFVIMGLIISNSDYDKRGQWRYTFDKYLNNTSSYTFRYIWIVITSLLTSFVYHGIAVVGSCSRGGAYKSVVDGTKKNTARWVEHAGGGALMFLAVACTVGITNIELLAVLAFMDVSEKLLNITMESGEGRKGSSGKVAWVIATLHWSVKWIILAIHYFYLVTDKPVNAFPGPGWILFPTYLAISMVQHWVAVPWFDSCINWFAGGNQEAFMTGLEFLKRCFAAWFIFGYFLWTNDELDTFQIA